MTHIIIIFLKQFFLCCTYMYLLWMKDHVLHNKTDIRVIHVTIERVPLVVFFQNIFLLSNLQCTKQDHQNFPSRLFPENRTRGCIHVFISFFEIPARNITSANVWEHMSSHMKVSGVCSPFVMQPCDALSRASCRWYIPVIEPWYYSCTLWVRAKRKSYCNLYVSEHQYVTWRIAYNWNIHIFLVRNRVSLEDYTSI